MATPFESPIAVALHGANVFAVAPPCWSEIADAIESIQFAAAIEEPPCFADAKIMLPGEDSACASPAEDETALALPPLAFAVELLRESEIATPVPPSEAFALAPERAPAVAFATPRVCEVANALEPAPSPCAVLVAPLPSDWATQAPRVKLCLETCEPSLDVHVTPAQALATDSAAIAQITPAEMILRIRLIKNHKMSELGWKPPGS